MTKDEADNLIADYEVKHGFFPVPYGFHSIDIAEVLAEYMDSGIPSDYNWLAELPDGADA